MNARDKLAGELLEEWERGFIRKQWPAGAIDFTKEQRTALQRALAAYCGRKRQDADMLSIGANAQYNKARCPRAIHAPA